VTPLSSLGAACPQMTWPPWWSKVSRGTMCHNTARASTANGMHLSLQRGEFRAGFNIQIQINLEFTVLIDSRHVVVA
jgi:hypothetical protein